MDTLYIVMPAYNEEETISAVVKEWYPCLGNASPESRLVIVNDGSRDATASILEKLCADYPQLVALTKENSGHGTTVLYAYRYALEHGADYVFQTDSDGQTFPRYFAEFWQKRADYDMVIGAREIREDGFFRLVITRTLRGIIKLFFGVFVRDANLAYRLMKAEPLQEATALVPHDFYLANVLISIVFAKKNRKVLSIPVKVQPRQGGVNSVFAPQILKIGFRAIKDLWKFRKALRAAQ